MNKSEQTNKQTNKQINKQTNKQTISRETRNARSPALRMFSLETCKVLLDWRKIQEDKSRSNKIISRFKKESQDWRRPAWRILPLCQLCGQSVDNDLGRIIIMIVVVVVCIIMIKGFIFKTNLHPWPRSSPSPTRQQCPAHQGCSNLDIKIEDLFSPKKYFG